MTALQLLFSNDVIYFLDRDKTVDRDSVKSNAVETVAVKMPLIKSIEEPSVLKSKISESVLIDINKKRDLVIILKNYDDADLAFLTKVLRSIGRNVSEILVIDVVQHQNVNIKQIIANTKALFSFGVPFTELGFKSDLPMYGLKMVGEKNYLYTEDLKTIAKNEQNQKRNLWNSLKNIL